MKPSKLKNIIVASLFDEDVEEITKQKNQQKLQTIGFVGDHGGTALGIMCVVNYLEAITDLLWIFDFDENVFQQFVDIDALVTYLHTILQDKFQGEDDFMGTSLENWHWQELAIEMKDETAEMLWEPLREKIRKEAYELAGS